MDSTEIYSGTDWRIVPGKLPTAMHYLKLHTRGHSIFSFGKNKNIVHQLTNLRQLLVIGGFTKGKSFDTILEFDFKKEEWKKIGNMLEKRAAFDVTHINFDKDFEKWCTFCN